MFTMLNSARLSVGLQGVGLSEHATQHALAYARDRKQGRAPNTSAPAGAMDTTIHHPDVARTLMTMRAYTDATRAIRYVTAGALDRAHRLTDPARKTIARERNALLTPVAKAFSNEVASLGVQVHGGMGFVEETGAAQLMRVRENCRDLRGNEWHPGDRSRAAQAASVRRRNGATRDYGHARHS
jgi:alkylation response protein AidB-like acyl-CoA dehydrogenase